MVETKVHTAKSETTYPGSSFLLVIPGLMIFGFGLGLIMNNPAPWVIVGLGLGLFVQGIIVGAKNLKTR